MATSGKSPVFVHDRVAIRMTEPFFLELRNRNDFVWSNPRNWKLGFYFGKDDARLWVPARCACGALRDDKRVINFAHPLGKKAFRLLAFGYCTGLALVVTLIAAACGARW